MQDKGIRAGHGLLWVRYLPDPSLNAARVAYSLPKRVGSAVIRNRARRRLREVIRCLDQEATGGLPAGLYLVGVKNDTQKLSQVELRESLRSCLARSMERYHDF